jgi:hypothetical protein
MIMDKFMIGLFSVLGAIALTCVFGLLVALPVMWIWNDSLVPAVTFAKPIGWTQAWALMVLSSLLFKGAINTKD